MTSSARAISDFWSLFVQRAGDLAAAASAEGPAYDELLERLHQIDPGLFIELSADRRGRELIVTADGDPALFSLAREVVAAAPAVRGWTIRALKPKLGFPESTRWDDLTVRVASLVFEPLEVEGSHLGLRIFVPGIGATEVDKAHNAVLRALDHGLGEETLAAAVKYTEVRPLPSEAPTGEFIPLDELERFIAWRAQRRAK